MRKEAGNSYNNGRYTEAKILNSQINAGKTISPLVLSSFSPDDRNGKVRLEGGI